MKARLGLLILLAAVAVSAPILSATAASSETVTETALDRHTRLIAEQLRCLVCQGQSVADSNSGLADDMRAIIREKLAQGWSDEQIREYFVARYGDYVLYQPPLETSTWVLWFGPLVLLGVGLTVLYRHLRGRVHQPPPQPLTAQDTEKARALLDVREESPR